MHTISDLLFWRLVFVAVMVSVLVLGVGGFALARRCREWMRSAQLDRQPARALGVRSRA